MNEQQTKQLSDAYNAWQVALNQSNGSYQEFLNIEKVLNADPQKWSTTILNYNGNDYQRQDLQAAATRSYNAAQSQKNYANELKSAYDKLNSDILAANTAAAAAISAGAQNAFNAANPEVALAIENAKTKAASVQVTTKYLIYGAIALVIVIGVILIVRKKYAA